MAYIGLNKINEGDLMNGLHWTKQNKRRRFDEWLTHKQNKLRRFDEWLTLD